MSAMKGIEDLNRAVDWNSQVSFCDDKIVAVSEVVKILVDNLQLESVRKILLDRYLLMKKLYGNVNGAERKGKSEIIPEKRSLPEQTIDLLFLSLIGEAMRGPDSNSA